MSPCEYYHTLTSLPWTHYSCRLFRVSEKMNLLSLLTIQNIFVNVHESIVHVKAFSAETYLKKGHFLVFTNIPPMAVHNVCIAEARPFNSKNLGTPSVFLSLNLSFLSMTQHRPFSTSMTKYINLGLLGADLNNLWCNNWVLYPWKYF